MPGALLALGRRRAHGAAVDGDGQPGADGHQQGGDDEHREHEGEGTSGWATAYVGIIRTGTAIAATIAPQAPSQLPTMLFAVGRAGCRARGDDAEGHGHQGHDRQHVQPAEGAVVDVPDPERGDGGPQDEHHPHPTEQPVAGVALGSAPHLVAAEDDAGERGDDVGDDEQGPGVHVRPPGRPGRGWRRLLLQGGDDGAHGDRERRGVGAGAPDHRLNPSPSTSAAAWSEAPPCAREGQAATVAAPRATSTYPSRARPATIRDTAASLVPSRSDRSRWVMPSPSDTCSSTRKRA